MATDAAASGVTDPLSGLAGPSLFPRTFKVSAGFLTSSDPKTLDSIHSLMRSLELRSPEKLMNQAKRIVDGGAELLESYHSSLFKNVGNNDATHAKGKDKPQERRPGLGLVRKRALFSLKTNTSQPTVTRKNNVDLDSIDDPDEYFDAYERMEKANKEIQKQLGGNVDEFSLYNPSNNERRRRPGILGKTYTYKHRFTKGLSENDVSFMTLQEIADADNPRSHEENSQKADEEDILRLLEDYVPKVAEEDIPGPPEDPNPDSSLEEVELAGSMKNTENEYSNILQEVLSFNYEDLQGHGALNLLQERLNIKPLDIENLGMTKRLDVGMRNSIFTVPETERHQKSVRNSLAIDRVSKILNRKPTTEHKQVLDPINHVSTPTPPRSPFASMSTLRKKILQPNPLGDPFSPMDVERSKTRSAFAVLLEDKLSGRVDAPADLGMYNELESHVNVVNMEPLVFNMDAQDDLGNADGLPKLLLDDNGGLQNAQNNSEPFEEHGNDFDRTMNVTTDESNPSVLGEEARDDMLHTQQTVPEQQPEIEPLVFNMDAQEDPGNTDGLPKLLVDENAGLPNAHDNSRPFEEHDNDFDRTMNVNMNESNPSILGVEARDDMSSSQQTDTEQPHEEYQTKQPRRTRAAGEKRIRKYHPMRKSLAEAGTSLETGVRRSTRVKMRALEYWRGERFLYGRVDDSLKLVGVKYMSPSGNENLKVKPYISSESSKFREILDMEAC